MSLDRLRGEVALATDWRRQFNAHRTQVIAGAAITGFVVAGGIAAFGGLFRRRR